MAADQSYFLNRVFTRDEIAELYKALPNHWMLLEPVEKGKNGTTTKVKILNMDKDKDVLRDWLLDRDEWEDSTTLIYFFASTDGTCDF